MMGWENEAKFLFWALILGASLTSFILMLIVLCNIHTSALRKRIFVQEMSSLAQGLTLLTLILTLNWTWFPLSYFRFDRLEYPNFYPAFQILNSFMGVFAFLGIGLGSQRFRHVLKAVGRHQQDA